MDDRLIDRVLKVANDMDMSQKALAEALGTSPQSVTNWKRLPGRDMPYRYLPAAAAALGRSIYELLGLRAETTEWPFPEISPGRFARLSTGEKLQVQGVMIDKIAELEQLKPHNKSSTRPKRIAR